MTARRRTVVDARPGAWQLLDGQQRINALYCLFTDQGAFGRFLLEMTVSRVPPGPTTSRQNKDRALGHIVWRDKKERDLQGPVPARERHLDLSRWLAWAEAAPGRVAQTLDEVRADPAQVVGVLKAIDPEFTAVLDAQQTRVAASRLERLLLLWGQPLVPVMRTEVDSPLDVLEVFTRINLGGVQVGASDVYFAAVKTFWPQAEVRLAELDRSLGLLSRAGALQLLSRLSSRGIGQADLVPLTVDRLAGPRGEWLITAMDRISSPDSPVAGRMRRLADLLRTRSSIGYSLTQVSWQLWDEVLVWAAATPTDDEWWWQQNIPLIDAYLLGATMFRYPQILGGRYRRIALHEALAAGTAGEMFPLEAIVAVARSSNPELRGSRQAVLGLSAAEDRRWLADRNAGLLLSIGQQIPYDVQGPVDWDHIFPQAQASRMWAVGDRGRRVHHQYRSLVQSVGNLWAMDASTNRALQDTPPYDKFELLEAWLTDGGGYPVWPKDRWFLEEDEAAEFRLVDRLLTEDPASIDSAMNHFRQVISRRAERLLQAALLRLPSAALFAADAHVAPADPARYDETQLAEALQLSDVMRLAQPSQDNNLHSDVPKTRREFLAASPEWSGREEELCWVVREATKWHTKLTDPNRRSLPSGAGEGFDFRRYLYLEGPGPGTHIGVGIVGRFAAAGQTPVWLQLHSSTGAFATARHRIMTSVLAAQVREDDGHVWLPLGVTPDKQWQKLADQVIQEVAGIRRVIEGPYDRQVP